MLFKKIDLGIGALLFFSLLLSNASALFITFAWLTPSLVYGQSVIWLVLAAVFIWLLAKNHALPKILTLIKGNWIILPFLIFSGLSIFWSDFWQISLARWTIFICTIILCAFMGRCYSIRQNIRLWAFFGVFLLCLNGLMVLFIPRIGIMNYFTIQGAWKGIYWHKIHLGIIATLISILFLVQLIQSLEARRRIAIVWGALYLVSLIFVYKSDSVTADITTLVSNGLVLLGLVWLKIRPKLRQVHYLIFLAVVVICLVEVFLKADFILGLFNRSTNLTGRIPMWMDLYRTYISQRLFGGYGFNAFWYIAAHRLSMQKMAGYPEPIVISDNGFIDILVNTGIAGLACFLILYIGMWWQSVKYALKATDITGLFPVILMAYTLLTNVSWSLIFENENFIMLIMLSVLFCITQANIHPVSLKSSD